MSLTREEVLHIAKLARVGMSEDDVVVLQEQLSDLLGHFEALQKVPTDDVPPTSHPLPLESVMRPDEVAPSLSRDEVLANAPLADQDRFRVRAVLDE